MRWACQRVDFTYVCRTKKQLRRTGQQQLKRNGRWLCLGKAPLKIEAWKPVKNYFVSPAYYHDDENFRLLRMIFIQNGLAKLPTRLNIWQMNESIAQMNLSVTTPILNNDKSLMTCNRYMMWISDLWITMIVIRATCLTCNDIRFCHWEGASILKLDFVLLFYMQDKKN